MKGRLIILIFLFFTFTFGTVSAATYENGSLQIQAYTETETDYREDGPNKEITAFTKYMELHYKSFADSGEPNTIEYDNVQFTYTVDYADIPASVGGPFIVYDGTTEVGRGNLYIFKEVEQSATEVKARMLYMFEPGFDTSGVDKIYDLRVYTHVIDNYYDTIDCEAEFNGDHPVEYTTLHIGIAPHPEDSYMHSHGNAYNSMYITYSKLLNFRNDYSIEIGESLTITDVFRDFSDNLVSSRMIVRNEDDSLYYQSGYSSSNATYIETLNATRKYYLKPEQSETEYFIYQYSGPSVDASATISFNESHYIKPDRVNVSWDGSNFDFVYSEYWVTVKGSQDGVSNWQYIDYDYETQISADEEDGNRSVALYQSTFDYPFYIKSIIYSYDYGTGDTTVLDTSDIITYSSGYIEPGSISTDKSNYNVSELVEISYTTNVSSNFIFVEEPHSYWVEHDVPVGTYSFMYELSDSAVGDTIIYLSENDVRVDSVTISVSSDSGGIYVAWMKDYYNKGELASFYYNSSNSSAQITVFDGNDNVVYGPATTQLGYHNGRVNTAGTEPGTFLVSLYHNGTYYNDTMILESVDSWVRFDSSKYYVGDTINIEYYLADPTECISMWDGNNGLIIRFTTQHGVLTPYSMQTVPFTLSEYNEYSIDVPAKLTSGELSLGFWSCFIEDSNGVLVGNEWDETYVTRASDDESYATDTSNDLIRIFFSPEGAFLIFTAALTMMGLVAAKHPAGGGAGAVVGVGFGVYFNILPVWMLMLTVIALVVLAGVSVAVHFRGK